MTRTRLLGAFPIIFCVLCPLGASAATCLAPVRPFVPSDPADAREYRDLIVQDFETYLSEISAYFRCLDEERARAFQESNEVAQEYGRFIQATTD